MRVSAKRARGESSVNWTVMGSTASTVMPSYADAQGHEAGSARKRKLSTTAAASSGVPSVKVTPSRSLAVHTVKSSLCSTDSASEFWATPSGPSVVRPS